ncbi:MAG TPA: serine/threonine-protein kinase, partial [Blastocatellia bacterium]|nr:serine/threonine-protein kinase [Blastocatellia bacterium]
MTPERWQQIENLYHAALEREPESRANFLAKTCGEDAELRREIESLLASHQQAASFIEKPPADIAAGMMAEKHPVIGRTLGHYTIQSKIGAGGMGEVYRAQDLRLDRDVAVKILPEHLAQDAEALRRFEREAKAVAALSHPNILSIFDFGTEEGVSYAVMELLEGETLRARLQRGAIGWREAAEIGSAIAEGLAAAHVKHIIHRDLKPENIFLTTGNQVKILDFGIARVKHNVTPDAETLSGTDTKPGTVMGTIGYMSPEQVCGLQADAPSDIFSFGVVLYEMLSGERPFTRSTGAETIAAILKEAPPSLSKFGRKTPARFEQLIRNCLEKKPEVRQQSAQALAHSLRAFAEGRKTQNLQPEKQVYWKLAAMIGVAILALLLSVL